MHTHRTPDVALWDHYRALREQWTHEDNLIAQRMGWLIWSEGLLCFVFEAFDEPWKGSPDPLEPEKHWGLFTVDRRPKLVMQGLYPDLAPQAATA
jgi:hypothetical protein